MTGLSRTQLREAARNRVAGSTKWNILTYDLYKTVYWLYVIEYATLNTQAPFKSALGSDGCRQGGLGEGVTGLTTQQWLDFNSCNPFVACGVSDSLGNRSGFFSARINAQDDDYYYDIPRYRGIENLFGHIWKCLDGINVKVGVHQSDVYVCKDPAKFSDTAYTDYALVGNLARSTGFVRKIIGGEGGEIMASETGGSNTTYFCDYFYACH